MVYGLDAMVLRGFEIVEIAAKKSYRNWRRASPPRIYTWGNAGELRADFAEQL
jgi:hypothetical protein